MGRIAHLKKATQREVLSLGRSLAAAACRRMVEKPPATPLAHFGDSADFDQMVEVSRAHAAAPGIAHKPLHALRNAHRTNTYAQLEHALRGGFDCLEGDVRWVNGSAVMSHDPSEEGMSLGEWIRLGVQSGRMLKVDLKDARCVPSVIASLREEKVDPRKLILNADIVTGPGAGKEQLALRLLLCRKMDVLDMYRLREEFPEALLSLGIQTGSRRELRAFSRVEIRRLIAAAKLIGGPLQFPLRAECATEEIVQRLRPYGAVAIWHHQSTFRLDTVEKLERAREKFRAWGADGMIDLEVSPPQDE